MTLRGKTNIVLLMMIFVYAAMVSTVVSGSPLSDAQELADASAAQLLARAVVVLSGVIVVMAGVIVQAYRSRVKALEHQVEACRTCAKQIAEAVRKGA